MSGDTGDTDDERLKHYLGPFEVDPRRGSGSRGAPPISRLESTSRHIALNAGDESEESSGQARSADDAGARRRGTQTLSWEGPRSRSARESAQEFVWGLSPWPFSRVG